MPYVSKKRKRRKKIKKNDVLLFLGIVLACCILGAVIAFMSNKTSDLLNQGVPDGRDFLDTYQGSDEIAKIKDMGGTDLKAKGGEFEV